jgi:hypothetical protein
MHPGPFFAAGTVAGDDRILRWSVENADGRRVARDEVFSGTDGRAGTYTVPLDLAEGAYTLVLRPGTGPGSSSDCPATARSSFTVVPESVGPTWLSGASGDAVSDGEFAPWRGTEVPIAGTWADSNRGQRALWQLQPDGQYGDWPGSLEIAIGAIDAGETWAAAAQGAYDDRWRSSLRGMARLWGDRPGRLYIRLAHEFNGDWYPWSVTGASREDFVTAWRRFRVLQLEEFPGAALVFAPNCETPGSNQLDWREAFPGPEYVDVMSVSYFNGYPWIDTAEAFQDVAMRVDHMGAPRGIQRHLEFARSVGLPFAVSEWNTDAAFGDSPGFMQQMDQFFRANAGAGPGQLLYEILFNVLREDNRFALMPETRAPLGAEAYRRLW